MSERGQNRSGLQTAANLVRLANSVRKIIQAALKAGIKGAAVVAVKEAAPLIVKIVIGVVLFLIVTSVLVFAAIPNIFFGYENTETAEIQEMNDRAAALGGVYMSLEDFQRTEIDAIVTSIATEYERQGYEIESIEVTSSFNEEDLMWMISINSVAFQQDLNVMTAENIRELCKTQMDYNLWDMLFGEGTITLKIEFQKLDPEKAMDDLGFDDEAKTWVRAFYETLSESDALNTYADQFAAFVPSYSGVTWDGGYTHGDSYDNAIDMSGFTDPSTKNNLDLAAYATQAWENNWGYVWGTYGSVLTQSLFDYKLQQYPDGVGNYEQFIRENWLGRRTTDCVGLVKGYGWLDASDGTIKYATNGMPDYAADQMYRAAVGAGADNGTMANIPEIPGLVLWMEGHTGVYIGNGYAVEAMGTRYGVVRTEIANRGWQAWYKIPYITYLD